jgi:hypothetical protein
MAANTRAAMIRKRNTSLIRLYYFVLSMHARPFDLLRLMGLLYLPWRFDLRQLIQAR